MTLITRFSRLFTADIHAVLDRIEEPDALLKQAVREMDEELSAMHAQTRSMRSELERLNSHDNDIHDRLDDLEEELDACFASGEEMLARSLIKRKLEAVRQRKEIAVQRDLIAKTRADLDAAIVENQHHLAGMVQKLEVLAMETHAAGPVKNATVGDYLIDNDEVEIAFLREKQRRAQP